MTERIVISGLGAVSPSGQTLDEIRVNLSRGSHPIRPLTSLPTADYPSHLGAELTGFSSEGYIDPMQARRMDRVSQMSCVAAAKAIQDAGLENVLTQNERVGVAWGTGLGSTSFTDEFFVGLVQKGPLGANPMLFPNTVPNAAASYVSILFKTRGINTTFCHKEISAELALIYALRQLQKGHCDVVLVGGAEEISPFLFHAFSVTRSLAPRDRRLPEQMAPYDRDRNGLVLGEGAAVLVLERESHCLQRSGKIYATVLAAETASAPVGPLGYDRQGRDITGAVTKSLASSQLSPEQIDFISGSGNSTTLLDQAEVLALDELFSRAGKPVPLAGLKGYTGCFHGGGALRLLMGLVMMNHDYQPLTPNLRKPLAAGHLDFIQAEGRQTRMERFIHLASSYGGTSCAIIIQRWRQ